MKNKLSNDRLSYFLTPRIHRNVLAWVKPTSAAERGKRVNENILRWEDDGGGTIIEVDYSTHDQKRKKPNG